MWKGVYQGQRVAVKVLRVYLTSDLKEIRRVGRLHIPFTVGVGRLTVTHAEILQRGDKVECPQPPKRIAPTGSDDGRESIRDGV